MQPHCRRFSGLVETTSSSLLAIMTRLSRDNHLSGDGAQEDKNKRSNGPEDDPAHLLDRGEGLALGNMRLEKILPMFRCHLRPPEGAFAVYKIQLPNAQ
jgi:hypothetical protein